MPARALLASCWLPSLPLGGAANLAASDDTVAATAQEGGVKRGSVAVGGLVQCLTTNHVPAWLACKCVRLHSLLQRSFLHG